MILIEKKMDVFANSEDCYLAHCISSDCAMGAGIAVAFQERYALREQLLQLPQSARKAPTSILVGRVFNLITKERYFQKPSYTTVRGALEVMKQQVVEKRIQRIAMPRIACGLDRLEWPQIKSIIEEVFDGVCVVIIVCRQ